jgi:ADP-heptose:LPS heptosyltransferase
MIKLTGQQLVLIDRLFWCPQFILENISFYTPKTDRGFKKVVVLKFLGLGSLIFFARLCEQNHVDKSKITLVTFDRHREFCRLFGFDSALFVRTSGLISFMSDCLRIIVDIQKMRPSIIINYERASHSIGTLTNLLGLSCKARTMSFQIGRTKENAKHIIHDVTSLTYEDVFLKGISLMEKKSESKKTPDKISPNQKILVNINASDYLLARRYPLKSFANALQSIHEWNNQIQFYFTGTLSERNYIQELTKQIPECNAINTAGDWSLEKLAGEVAHCALFITCDSGPLHIAAYFETPTIVIWGPTQPQHFGYETHKSFSHISLKLSCSPCFVQPHSKAGVACSGRIDCLTNLDPQRIAEVAISVLSDPPTKRSTQHLQSKMGLLENTSTLPLVTSS